MDGFATSPAESPAIKRPLSRPPLRSAWDPWILLLTFLPFGLGLFLFGGVRLWSIGPLSLCVFLALAFFWGRDRKAGTEIRLPPGSLFFSLFLLYAFIQAGLASEVPWDARIKALMITSAIGALFLWTALADRGNRWKVLL
ncbi:MAG: hypothetical protein U1E27_10235, partial [Kiritimatiellia bacterium]|nr:hypothetical protein [Kiritimatiellia bacterium]